MSAALPQVYLVRHGETEWSLSGRHTGRTDLPLTPKGEQNALRIGERLRAGHFDHVLSSPLQRARRTCELAGFGERMTLDADLVEWDYGEYEGLRTAEILARNPNWQLFRDGCPGGESVAQIGARADRVVQRVRALDGSTALFASAHILRVIAARWLGLETGAGRLFTLGTASISMLGYEHNREEPAVLLWNSREHLDR